MRYAAIIVTLFLVGCATLVSVKDVPPDVRTQTYQAPYEQVFSAVMEAYTAKGFGVDEADREVGLVKSQYKQSSNIVGAKSRSRFSASITKVDSSTTRVRLTMTAQQQSVGGWSSASVTQKRAHELYASAFDTIGDQLSQ